MTDAEHRPAKASSSDLEHLKLLAIFHYIVAGLLALFACIPVIHLIFGLLILTGTLPMEHERGHPVNSAAEEVVGLIIAVFAGVAILIGWTVALLVFLAGRKLARYRGYAYCFVIAVIECLFMPFGTILGVFTIVVLSRDSVKALFAEPPRLSEY